MKRTFDHNALLHRLVPLGLTLAGLAAVCWVGIGYIGSNPLALVVTGLIGVFYLMGAVELSGFRQATSTLTDAVTNLTEAPASLGQWLDRLHPSLRNAVRSRIEGERVGLPGPALTPYLAGLLVLLGMLGTFLGMVVTLNGTGMALESASDLQSIRASLAAPVKGLGLAFGTSLAGVAASAMLGLVSALCRRDRLQAAQTLDTRIATTLRAFSLAHRREESFRLLQVQAEAMPALVDRLQSMMASLEQHSASLNERVVSHQDHFHHKAEAAYLQLATSVDRSLRESLTESARLASEAIRPAVDATMAEIAGQAASLHEAIGHSVQRHLDGVSSRQESSAADMNDLWKTSLALHQHTSEAQSRDLSRSLERFAEIFEQRSASLLQTVDQAHAGLRLDMAAHDEQQLAAASELGAELRRKLSDSLARDNAMLEERGRIFDSLRTVLDGVNHGSADQRAAIDALVKGSAGLLERVGVRFTEKVDAESERMAAVSAQLTGSAAEVASLGEAFGFAVQLFSQSNEKLGARLQHIESTLAKSTARSDEQLAYYVAQAREVIDLSILSQKQIVEDLQRLAESRALAGAEA